MQPFYFIKLYILRYLVTSPQDQLTLYYEPHCVYDKNFLEKERADIVISPVIKQLLPNFTLVSGQEDAVQLAKMLGAKYTLRCFWNLSLFVSLKNVVTPFACYFCVIGLLCP